MILSWVVRTAVTTSGKFNAPSWLFIADGSRRNLQSVTRTAELTIGQWCLFFRWFIWLSNHFHPVKCGTSLDRCAFAFLDTFIQCKDTREGISRLHLGYWVRCVLFSCPKESNVEFCLDYFEGVPDARRLNMEARVWSQAMHILVILTSVNRDFNCCTRISYNQVLLVLCNRSGYLKLNRYEMHISSGTTISSQIGR
jgi:hypothetical protein